MGLFCRKDKLYELIDFRLIEVLDGLDSIDWRLKTNNALISEQNRLLGRLIKLLTPKIPNPGSLHFILKEASMADVFNYSILLPALSDDRDIEKGQLSISTDGGDFLVIDTTKEQTEVVGLSGPQGALVTASFVYIDDAGNASEIPAVLNFSLDDTVPPANPGELGVRIDGEIQE